MRLGRLSGLAFLLFLLADSASGRPMDVPPSFAHRYLPSVLTIVGLGKNDLPLSSGTGFFSNSQGEIVTSHHILEGCLRAEVRTFDGQKGIIIEILGDDPELDLLRARTSLKNSRPLLLGDSDAVRLGAPIMTIGGRTGAVASGKIEAMRKTEGFTLLQISAPVSPGQSGGPVLDGNGKVIGIVTGFLDAGEDLSFAVPVNYLKSLEPVRLSVKELPRRKMRIEAALSDREVIELFLTPATQGPGIVYFKSGKKLLCDRAWKDGDTVFLVAHGKHMAIGYHESLLDMKRSFVNRP